MRIGMTDEELVAVSKHARELGFSNTEAYLDFLFHLSQVYPNQFRKHYHIEEFIEKITS